MYDELMGSVNMDVCEKMKGRGRKGGRKGGLFQRKETTEGLQTPRRQDIHTDYQVLHTYTLGTHTYTHIQGRQAGRQAGRDGHRESPFCAYKYVQQAKWSLSATEAGHDMT
jgi:hypothetical protein